MVIRKNRIKHLDKKAKEEILNNIDEVIAAVQNTQQAFKTYQSESDQRLSEIRRCLVQFQKTSPVIYKLAKELDEQEEYNLCTAGNPHYQ